MEWGHPYSVSNHFRGPAYRELLEKRSWMLVTELLDPLDTTTSESDGNSWASENDGFDSQSESDSNQDNDEIKDNDERVGSSFYKIQ